MLLPTDGRAASITRSERWTPPSSSSRSERSRHQRGVRHRQEVRRRGLILQIAVEDVPEGLEVALLSGVPDRVDCVLGLPERGLQVVGVAVAQLGDPGPRGDELPHGGGAGHDLGVVLGVDRGGCDGDQVREVGHAAHQLQPLGPGQFTGKGGLVDGLVSIGKGQRGVVAQLVPLPVEVPGLERGCDAGDALAVDQQRTYEGLLGIGVVGQQPLGV